MKRFAALLPFLVVIICVPLWGHASDTCPAELLTTAAAYEIELQELEILVRDSSVESQKGIEPTSVFDRDNHVCHEAPGQAYRVYTAPRCAMLDQMRAALRYDYTLLYRHALSVEALFSQPWKEGTGGTRKVVFELQEQGWVPVSQKDELSFDSKGEGHIDQ